MALQFEEIREKVEEVLERSPDRNFDESIDLAINLKNLDMSNPQSRVDEEVILPNGLGKPVRIAVFARGETAVRARDAGAERVIAPEEIDELGEDLGAARSLASEFDAFIAEAQYMPDIGRNLGKIFAPRGKMPEPLMPDDEIEEVLARKRSLVRLRSRDKTTFHVAVGRRDMPVDDLAENVRAVLTRLEHSLEKGPHNIHSIYVKTTMGPAVRMV